MAMKMVTSVAALTLLLASLAGPVTAHQTGQQGSRQGYFMPMMGWGMMCDMPMMQGRGMGPGMMQGMGMGPMMGGPAQHIEGRIAFLRTELGITEAQASLFNTYADALRAAAKSMQGMHSQMMSGSMPATLPERLSWHEQMMATHLEAVKKLRAAAVPLSNALSAEQKQTADSLMMGIM